MDGGRCDQADERGRATVLPTVVNEPKVIHDSEFKNKQAICNRVYTADNITEIVRFLTEFFRPDRTWTL